MTHGAVATPHSLATQAATDAFAAGGNAIDAALVAAAVLTVVYPHQCGIGGDLFALVHRGAGRTRSINGSGRLPKSVDVERLRATCTEVPPYGPHSITVPGMVAGWESIAELGATFTPAGLLAPAIELASGGIEVSSSLAAGIGAQWSVLRQDEGMREVFLAGGSPVRRGGRVTQPALARTLRTLAREGFMSFYVGEVGERLKHGLRALGAQIAGEDLSSHRSEVTAPLTHGYGGVELATSPPNSQGVALLQACAALEAMGIGIDALDEAAGDALRACLLAAADRDALLGDPQRTDVPLDDLLDGDRQAARMRRSVHGDVARAPLCAHGDTVAVCTMDGEGNAVSLIQSVYQTFGAGVLESQTGIIMHNRARGFSLEPGAPNEMVPGTRPAHTLMPLLLFRDGTAIASLGTMGGKAQPQVLLQILPRVLDPAAGLRAGLAAPRWVFGSLDIGFERLTVAVEADAPARLDEELAAAGLPVTRVGARDERMGHANAVRLAMDGGLESASDPRSDGSGATL